MEAHLTMTCGRSCAARRLRIPTRARPTLGARLTTLAIVLIGLLVMSYGQHWVLARSALDANELTMATCVVDAVYGDAGRAAVCTSGVPSNDKEAAR